MRQKKGKNPDIKDYKHEVKCVGSWSKYELNKSIIKWLKFLDWIKIQIQCYSVYKKPLNKSMNRKSTT